MNLEESSTLSSFLFDSPITLTESDRADIARRKTLDANRKAQLALFEKEVEARAAEMEIKVKELKVSLMDQHGLTEFMRVLRDTEDITALPKHYQSAVEWGRLK